MGFSSGTARRTRLAPCPSALRPWSLRSAPVPSPPWPLTFASRLPAFPHPPGKAALLPGRSRSLQAQGTTSGDCFSGSPPPSLLPAVQLGLRHPAGEPLGQRQGCRPLCVGLRRMKPCWGRTEFGVFVPLGVVPERAPDKQGGTARSKARPGRRQSRQRRQRLPEQVARAWAGRRGSGGPGEVELGTPIGPRLPYGADGYHGAVRFCPHCSKVYPSKHRFWRIVFSAMKTCPKLQLRLFCRCPVGFSSPDPFATRA